MLNYHIKILVLYSFIVINIFIVSILPTFLNYEISVNTNVYLDIYTTNFSLQEALLPIMLIIHPFLAILYHKNPDRIIKLCLLSGAIAYLMYFTLFDYYSLVKTIFLLIGFSMFYSNMFFLAQRLICTVRKPYLAISFICACPLIGHNVMMLIDYMLKNQIFLNIKVIIFLTTLILLGMFIIYTNLVLNNKRVALKSPFKKILKRYPIYLINFLKHKQVLKLSILFFLNGIIIGLISQYISHYISHFNHQSLKNILIFQLFAYSLFFMILILLGTFLKSSDSINMPSLLSISFIMLCVNIILVIVYSENTILNKILIINYMWFCFYVFMLLLISYFNSFGSHKFCLMMIIGYILNLFGSSLAHWVDMIVIDIKISLYFALIMISILFYVKKRMHT